ncbi:ketoacyl-ACP synthase III [Flavobacterium sp. Arc3]|jgi:3-oxoacyl-[acyl-carrier-protein] synthase-3|uniref:3-oxoacyl-ACP synthase III family protein n=1 Tax=Flavobacterium sp. Arc3 TaxID=3046686 RepID=UPI00352E5EA0
MATLSFKNIGISGIAAAVPKNTIDNYAYTEFFPEEDVEAIVDKVGIKERRFAPEGMCASDLCFAAAEQLISDLQINKDEIDLLVFVSQTPDYRMPATSIILQHRLGLAKHTAAFDISLGCSAFIYGLSIVYGLMQSGGFRKALLLDGETRSKVYSPKDRKTAFLFGDGGVAAIIEQNEKFGKSFFSLNSDGSKSDLIKMDAGGYRNPSSAETTTEKVVDEYGNIRTDEHGYMNGADVFNFVLKEIPKNFKSVLEQSNNTNESIDFNIFHQANDYMNNYLAKKLKLDEEKVPSSIAEFGNTSSVSIPLTIVSQLQNQLQGPKKLMLCGFGVGMSWATAQVNLVDCKISNIVEI